MTAPDPVSWLRSQIETRKALALKATPGPWEFEGDDITDDELISVHDGEHGDLIGQIVAFTRHLQVANGEHMAANDPQDTIARCEAELAILDEHGPEWNDFIDGDGDDRTSIDCKTCETGGTPDNYPCKTVRLLAGGYRHRPGFNAGDWEA